MLINDIESLTKSQRSTNHTVNKEYVRTLEFVNNVSDNIANDVMNTLCDENCIKTNNMTNELLKSISSICQNEEEIPNNSSIKNIQFGVAHAIAKVLTSAKKNKINQRTCNSSSKIQRQNNFADGKKDNKKSNKKPNLNNQDLAASKKKIKMLSNPNSVSKIMANTNVESNKTEIRRPIIRSYSENIKSNADKNYKKNGNSDPLRRKSSTNQTVINNRLHKQTVSDTSSLQSKVKVKMTSLRNSGQNKHETYELDINKRKLLNRKFSMIINKSSTENPTIYKSNSRQPTNCNSNIKKPTNYKLNTEKPINYKLNTDKPTNYNNLNFKQCVKKPHTMNDRKNISEMKYSRSNPEEQKQNILGNIKSGSIFTDVDVTISVKKSKGDLQKPNVMIVKSRSSSKMFMLEQYTQLTADTLAKTITRSDETSDKVANECQNYETCNTLSKATTTVIENKINDLRQQKSTIITDDNNIRKNMKSKRDDKRSSGDVKTKNKHYSSVENMKNKRYSIDAKTENKDNSINKKTKDKRYSSVGKTEKCPYLKDKKSKDIINDLRDKKTKDKRNLKPKNTKEIRHSSIGEIEDKCHTSVWNIENKYHSCIGETENNSYKKTIKNKRFYTIGKIEDERHSSVEKIEDKYHSNVNETDTNSYSRNKNTEEKLHSNVGIIEDKRHSNDGKTEGTPYLSNEKLEDKYLLSDVKTEDKCHSSNEEIEERRHSSIRKTDDKHYLIENYPYLKDKKIGDKPYLSDAKTKDKRNCNLRDEKLDDKPNLSDRKIEDKFHLSDSKIEDKFHLSNGKTENKPYLSDGKTEDKRSLEDGITKDKNSSNDGRMEDKSDTVTICIPVNTFTEFNQDCDNEDLIRVHNSFITGNYTQLFKWSPHYRPGCENNVCNYIIVYIILK